MLTAFVCVFTAHCNLYLKLDSHRVEFTTDRLYESVAKDSHISFRIAITSSGVGHATYCFFQCIPIRFQLWEIVDTGRTLQQRTNKSSLNNNQTGELLWYYEMRPLFFMQVVSNLNVEAGNMHPPVSRLLKMCFNITYRQYFSY